MQQRVRLGHIRQIAGRAHHGVNQTGSHVYNNMTLHPEMPIVTLLRLVHFRVTRAVLVLGRRWCRDQRGVNDGALAHGQAFAGKVRFDLIEHAAGQVVLFEQAAKLEQRRCVGRRLVGKVDADEIAYRTDVVNRVFDAFIGQSQALLGDIHAQHTLKAYRWSTAPVGLRIMRQQGCDQHRPRRRRIDLGQEALAARQLLLAGKLDVCKARLLHHFGVGDGMRNCASSAPHLERSGRLNQMVWTSP